MSSIGLLSGSADRAQRLSQLLKDAGADPVIITDPAALPGEPGGDGLDFYIQLPVTIHPEGDTAVARVGSFLSAGLLARFRAVDRVLPVLAPGATVVLVSGNTPDEVSLPDDQQSRLALLHLLAHATRAELATKNIDVRVVSSRRSDEEIVHYALGGDDDVHTARNPQERAGTAAAYQDWHTEVMGSVGIDI
jgi:NAD(P)-dependent dehydrogenase (short-subunit alcohol dehydrogenase family)